MATTLPDGNEIDILQLLPPMEGELNMYYGKIRNGKNYTATADIIEKLKEGKVIYANWEIKWEGFDQRKSIPHLILGLLGLKRKFYNFPKENYRFINFHELKPDFLTWLSTINDCEIFVDEAYIFFDSYKLTKLSMKERVTVLSTGHYNRTINVLSQRPSGIHVTLRGNVNRFFKIIKKYSGGFFGLIPPRFWKIEIQDMANEMPDETQDNEGNYLHAESITKYWGKKKIFESYNTQYLRGDMQTSQPNYSQLHYFEQDNAGKELILKLLDLLTKIKHNIKIKIINKINPLKLIHRKTTTQYLQDLQNHIK